MLCLHFMPKFAPPQSQDKAFTFPADQLVKFVANVVIQVAQPQVCYANPTQDAIDKKSSLCRRVSEAAKNHLGVNITGINLFDAIGQLRPSAPPTSKPKTSLNKGESSFKFTATTKLTKPPAISKPLSPPSTTNKAILKQLKSSKQDRPCRPSLRYLMFVFMGLNIMIWNSQGVRSKREELELYLKENHFDIVALNETFLTKKIDFKIQGYDTIKNDPSTGVGGGVAFLIKHGLVVNNEYRNTDFNIITDNEALVIDIDLCNNQNLILATIYCPNGNPNLRLIETINNLSNNVMFFGAFNSKLEAFSCAMKDTSGPMLKTIKNQLNLINLNTDEHTHLDRYTGNTDILDMAFTSPNLSKHDIQFLTGDDLGSNHLPIEIAIDTQPHRNTHINPVRYKFNQTDREVF